MVVKKLGMSFSWRLNDEVAVYTTEIVTIIKALHWVEMRPEKVVICSDSAAVLKSIQSFKSYRMDLLIKVFVFI